MSILEQVQQATFVYFGFDPAGEDKDNIWLATPALCISDDGINWVPIAEFPQLGNLRDGYIQQIGDDYWITGTLAIFKTNDFINFEYHSLDVLNQPNYWDIWAPEFVLDRESNQWKLIYCANHWGVNLYLADFDPQTGNVTNPYQEIDLPISVIDPDVVYLNGSYLLAGGGGHLFVSDRLNGPYREIETDLQQTGANWYEAAELLVVDDKILFYQDKITGKVPDINDSGDMVYATASVDDLTNWTKNKLVKCAINMRHGSFIYNGKAPYQEEYFPNIAPNTTFGTQVI
ncbi:hypothetical protein ACQW5G_00485 [Fructilactobacillus sp. Tb1]|uniref:hypothetical protein n=1 Tax=Fructilactobacillus sp. Tb1 TaxID=3422304 RepID=UPI003D2B3133